MKNTLCSILPALLLLILLFSGCQHAASIYPDALVEADSLSMCNADIAHTSDSLALDLLHYVIHNKEEVAYANSFYNYQLRVRENNKPEGSA